MNRWPAEVALTSWGSIFGTSSSASRGASPWGSSLPIAWGSIARRETIRLCPCIWWLCSRCSCSNTEVCWRFEKYANFGFVKANQSVFKPKSKNVQITCWRWSSWYRLAVWRYLLRTLHSQANTWNQRPEFGSFLRKKEQHVIKVLEKMRCKFQEANLSSTVSLSLSPQVKRS